MFLSAAPVASLFLGQFLESCGLVDQHRGVDASSFATDPDGVSGCMQDPMEYCQKFWPTTERTKLASKEVNVTTFCQQGNVECHFHHVGTPTNCLGTAVSGVLGEFAESCGHVDMHKAPGGDWVTDPDGQSGCNQKRGKYCNKFFPGTHHVERGMNATISGWCEPGNINCTGTFTVPVYRCLPVTPLGMFAEWCGHVNQHREEGGAWMTDDDGQSGCNQDPGMYCKKFWPETNSVLAGVNTTIAGWCDPGNLHCTSKQNVQSQLCLPSANIKVLGKYAEWCGKVDQHMTTGGKWMTDPDGESGCDQMPLEYCQKFWPMTIAVHAGDPESISGWCDNGNTDCTYTETKPTFECVA